MNTEQQISNEHVTNHQNVRKTLIERGIRPEKLSADEDIQKVARKLKSENKKGLKQLVTLKKK